MLKSLSFKEGRTVADALNIVLGVVLALSPWVLGYSAESAATWNAGLAGVAVALIAAGALVAFHEAEEWANIAIGVWTVIAPWVLGFGAVMAAVVTHVIVGALVAAVSAVGWWLSRNRPLSTA